METNPYCNNKARLVLQFHITGNCNLKCKHCYRTEGNVEPLSYEDVITVIEQFKELVTEFNQRHKSRRRGHINLTGGEPFVRKDIKEILRYLGANKESLSFGILSNGSFLDDNMISVLKETGVAFVQLSLDGSREMHDTLRTPGDYDRVLKTAEYLEQMGIPVHISFTANKENFKYLPDVAAECRKRKLTKLWSDRLVPIGTGQKISNLSITHKELPEYLAALKKARGSRLVRLLYPKTQVVMNRALQFLACKDSSYSCSAGKTLLTVDEFGNVMPCRRMPIVCGNIFDATLREIYYHQETFRNLRNLHEPKECGTCEYVYGCKGGARCQSFALYGNYYKADPACPKRKDSSSDKATEWKEHKEEGYEKNSSNRLGSLDLYWSCGVRERESVK